MSVVPKPKQPEALSSQRERLRVAAPCPPGRRSQNVGLPIEGAEARYL